MKRENEALSMSTQPDIPNSSTKKRGRKKKSEEKTDNKANLKQELITDHMPVEKKKRKIDRLVYPKS